MSTVRIVFGRRRSGPNAAGRLSQGGERGLKYRAQRYRARGLRIEVVERRGFCDSGIGLRSK